VAALLAAALVAAVAAGCKPRPAQTAPTTKVAVSAAGTTRIGAFSISEESLNIDKIGMRDGMGVPDGNRDLAFVASLEGPIDALYLVNCSDKGEPLHGFRADTIAGHEELPGELGSVVDVGRLTVWIAVMEGNKVVNGDGGGITLPAGRHDVKLYVPNTGTLHGGTHLRLYARAPGGSLVAGPVVPY